MSRFKISIALAAVAVLVGAFGATDALAGEFQLTPGTFDLTSKNKAGEADWRAGGHPFAVDTNIQLETMTDPRSPSGAVIPKGGNLRNGDVESPPGLVGNPTVVPACSAVDFYKDFIHNCSDDAQVGVAEANIELFGGQFDAVGPIYNMTPSSGTPAQFGFWLVTANVILRPELRSNGDYGLTIAGTNLDETVPANKIHIRLWGVPASSEHDAERGSTQFGSCSSVELPPPCSSHVKPEAFLTNPVTCSLGPLSVGLSVLSWTNETDSDSILTHDATGPTAMTGCAKVPFDPTIVTQPTTSSAEAPAGLRFDLEIPDTGIRNPTGIAQSEVKKVSVRLPKGTSINPSSGEGLGACTPADWAREKLDTPPGEGCPNASKLGTVKIFSPLLEEPADGSLFLAQTDDPTTSTPGAENPFDSLIAMYISARIPNRGIFVRATGRVTPDPQTGQLVTTFDNLPQLPFTKFSLFFREGQRAALSTPPTCGTYTTEAEMTPWSANNLDNPSPSEVEVAKADFQVTSGVGGAPCPSGNTPPFHPGLLAGAINNAAGKYSPFNVRLTRRDGEQEFTRFSIKLPPGIVGKLAGIPYCSDAAIEAARTRTATAELVSPSCPVASEVGHTLVGAGVGSIQTYIPGKVYLAGPYHGSSLSVAAITAAKVGPFDVGTVVIRQALKIDPNTAEVFIDAVGSDPIPHIVDGIPVHARDIRVYIDRPEFTLNPTNCERTSTASTVLGSGLDFVSDADDNPVTVTSPFQAADCASLPFKPKLVLSVSGATKRAKNPKFKAVLTMNPGEANIARAQVTLPKSEFLDNAHIGTVCTRVQFRANQCPPDSIYGQARAYTPILDQPIEGPVYLRSNPEHALPDLVAALKGQQIEIDLAGRVDSVGEGRIRNTFEAVPDAPVSKFVLEMKGGDKGLLENSANLCAKPQRSAVRFTGQNGRKTEAFPVLKPSGCRKGGKRHK